MPTSAQSNLPQEISDQLRKTFDTLAKLALQGSAEAGDPNLNLIEKMRKAHSRVTLIIDDAMRGLAEAHESMFISGIIVAVSIDDDEQGG